MKRALSERLKQLGDNGADTPQSSLQQDEQIQNDVDVKIEAPPPRKIPRIKSSSSPRTPSSVNNGNSSLSRPSQLPIPTIDDNEEDEENEATNTKFFLKHQNKALASELFKYKHAMTMLENERDMRREECKLINGALKDIVANWNGMEGALLGALGIGENESDIKVSLPASLSSIVTLPSTGTGDDVEHVNSIVQSIIQLAKSSSTFEKKDDNTQMKQEDNNLESDSLVEEQFMKYLSSATASFSNRISTFQRLVLNLIEQGISANTNAAGKSLEEVLNFSDLKKTIALLQNNCQDLEAKLSDLSTDRDIAKDNERKVRRGLYRVASGRMKITEVLKAVEESSSLGVEELDELQKELSSSSAKAPLESESSDTIKAGQGANTDVITAESSAIVIDGKTVGVDDVLAMKKKIDDLMLVNETRDTKISEMMKDKEEMNLKINSLTTKLTDNVVKEEDVKLSPLFIETLSQLEASHRDYEKLQYDMQSVMERWAATKGDLELSHKAINDLEEKYKRRIKELSGQEDEEGASNEEEIDNAKRVVQLEHKLKHALDNVRQATAMKSSLVDAAKMKDTLQRQIDELKEMNEQLEATHDETNEELLSTSDEEMDKEKIQKLKNELRTMMQSKEQAKRSLQLSESERDSLLAINVRLQQQMVDKEDMNTKSLSTILHLRQLSEQLEQEKSILEKKLKSSDQLAVMVRLTENARAKVENEAMQGKQLVEEEVKQLKINVEEAAKQNDKLQEQLSQAQSQVKKASEDMQMMKERCDHLVTKSTENEAQIKQLSEGLVIAKKDAVEAMQKAAATKSLSGATLGRVGPWNKTNYTEFTAEQLAVQVNHLKSRLACPVCNTRDKKVIITRCRHMFCRNCVELNLENRNRKCPSCGIKFDKRDVEDVWF